MQPKYTAQRLADTTNGWVVTEIENEKKSVVFCNTLSNTAEDAVELIEESLNTDEPT
jgi:hypothetical protein